MKITTKMIARAGVIAGLYTAISMLVFPLAGGAVQIRISEALCLLPLFFIEAIPALFIGCLVSNLILGLAVYDILLGSLITLLSAVLTYLIGKLIKKHLIKVLIGGIFPVVLNAVFLPLIWLLCYGTIEYVYYLQVLILFIGQAVSVYLFGIPLYFAVSKKVK